MAKQSTHALREKELRERVLAACARAEWHVEAQDVYSLGSIKQDLMIINYGEKLVAIEIKSSLTGNAFGEFVRRATKTLNPTFRSEEDYHPDEYWGISYEVAPNMMPSGVQIRIFTLAEFEKFALASEPKAEADGRPPNAASKLAANEMEIQLSAAGLINLIEERLQALRSERPNSDHAREHQATRIADYEKLKSQVQELAEAAAAAKAGKIQDAVAANLSRAFSEGLEKWWTKKHEMVLDVSVFTIALSICSLVGAGGWLETTALAGLVGGKKLTDALKGTKGKR
jgi:hypothetical protein